MPHELVKTYGGSTSQGEYMVCGQGAAQVGVGSWGVIWTGKSGGGFLPPFLLIF